MAATHKRANSLLSVMLLCSGWRLGAERSCFCLQVTSYNLSMREIDTVQNPGEYVPSAVEIIIRKASCSGYGGHTQVHSLIDYVPVNCSNLRR
jgi:hypothetical protein